MVGPFHFKLDFGSKRIALDWLPMKRNNGDAQNFSCISRMPRDIRKHHSRKKNMGAKTKMASPTRYKFDIQLCSFNGLASSGQLGIRTSDECQDLEPTSSRSGEDPDVGPDTG